MVCAPLSSLSMASPLSSPHSSGFEGEVESYFVAHQLASSSSRQRSTLTSSFMAIHLSKKKWSTTPSHSNQHVSSLVKVCRSRLLHLSRTTLADSIPFPELTDSVGDDVDWRIVPLIPKLVGGSSGRFGVIEGPGAHPCRSTPASYQIQW